jgi:hypothetical protein
MDLVKKEMALHFLGNSWMQLSTKNLNNKEEG